MFFQVLFRWLGFDDLELEDGWSGALETATVHGKIMRSPVLLICLANPVLILGRLLVRGGGFA